MILTLGGYYYNADTEDTMILSAMNADSIIKTGVDMRDADGDGLFDIYEKKGMQVSNGSIIKTDYKNADVDQDGLTDFQEMDASRLRIIYNEIRKNMKIPRIGTHEFSSYSSKDVDKDGLSDNKDPFPLVPHDKRFQLTKSLYDIPSNKNISDAKKAAEASYNKDTNTDPEHRKKLREVKNRAIANYAGGFYSTYLPTAAVFMKHFLLNTGELARYDAEKFLLNKPAKELYYKNVNTLINACEQMTMNNKSSYIISTETFAACKYSDKGAKNRKEKDWWFSVGNADCGMTAESSRNDQDYEMTLIYYVQDMYDWEEGSPLMGGLVTDGEMYQLHHAGMAREYESRGTYTAVIRWKKGQRFGAKVEPKEQPINIVSLNKSIQLTNSNKMVNN